MAKVQNDTMDKLVALCKGRGFVFPGSEIYGGLANSWDYGPLGVEFKNNVKRAWWKKFVQESKYNVGIDCAILMNRQVWVASGHVGNFNDPLMDCKACKARFRADKLIEDWAKANGQEIEADGWTNEQLESFIEEKQIPCPTCGKHDFTGIRKFNMMFKTHQGVTEDASNEIYLRPETAQGIFVNFPNVARTTRRKLPFGVCQVGKSFRNEITPGNFIFRIREFEQMELEFFCMPGTDLEWFSYWRTYCHEWLKGLGIKDEHLRLRDHKPEELAHYSKATTDFEYLFPFGWGELWGVADRTDFDLKQHEKFSGRSIKYFDPETNESYTPYDIETSIGVDRMFLSVMCHSYCEEKLENGETRVVLRLPAALAPVKLAVMPLVKKDGLPEIARTIMNDLRFHFNCQYDEKDSIGKRYRRQDAIGTPFCATIDHDTPNDHCVTLRNRDTMQQERVPIAELRSRLEEQVSITSLLKKLC